MCTWEAWKGQKQKELAIWQRFVFSHQSIRPNKLDSPFKMVPFSSLFPPFLKKKIDLFPFTIHESIQTLTSMLIPAAVPLSPLNYWFLGFQVPTTFDGYRLLYIQINLIIMIFLVSIPVWFGRG
jgi:hypothetical protein